MVTTAELPFITKTLIPRQRDLIVRRGRILEPMLARVDKKVQVVYAPAGYGKTALLTQFADETELPVCWYSFSPEEHDPVSILRYCVYSIRALYPDFGGQLHLFAQRWLKCRPPHPGRPIYHRTS